MKTPLQHWFEVLDKQVAQLKKVCLLSHNAEMLEHYESLSAQQPLVFDHLIGHLKLGWTIVQSNKKPPVDTAKIPSPITSITSLEGVKFSNEEKASVATIDFSKKEKASVATIDFSKKEKVSDAIISFSKEALKDSNKEEKASIASFEFSEEEKALKDSRKVWWQKENKQSVFGCLVIDLIRKHNNLKLMFGPEVINCPEPPIPTVNELRRCFKLLADAIDPTMHAERRYIIDANSFVAAIRKLVKSPRETYGGLSVLLSQVELSLKHSLPVLARREKSK
jgi:hypothetical protein